MTRYMWTVLLTLVAVNPAWAQPQSQPLQPPMSPYPIQPVQPLGSVDQRQYRGGSLNVRLDPVRVVPPLNINTSLQERFSEIPEIGEDAAESIVRNRPYHSVDELDRRRIIPHMMYLRLVGSLVY